MPERQACKYLVCRLFNDPADGWPTPKTKTGPVCSCLHKYRCIRAKSSLRVSSSLPSNVSTL